MAKSLNQRLNERSNMMKQQSADQKLMNTWMQGIKFSDSQARGMASMMKRKQAKMAGRAKARDIYLKDQA